jgi:hypothetical protein
MLSVSAPPVVSCAFITPAAITIIDCISAATLSMLMPPYAAASARMRLRDYFRHFSGHYWLFTYISRHLPFLPLVDYQ